jgi:hypothetical protein
MESKNNKLLQALERTGADKISEAYYWVQDNKNMFRAEVYGPVLLEVCFVACPPTSVFLASKWLIIILSSTDLRLIFRIRLTLLTWKTTFPITYGRY